MSEIVNIVGQLEEIVGTLGVPITSGGGRDDYLCAVSRGLVQFVCARSGRGVYRSLTAEKIHIHPGLGDVPRGARSTSWRARSCAPAGCTPGPCRPLRKALLGRISPLLAASLLGGAPYEAAAAKERRRDFTSQIRLGSGVFPIRVVKGGRKVVELEWEKLKPLLRELEPATLPLVQGPARHHPLAGTRDLHGHEARRHPRRGAAHPPRARRVGGLAPGAAPSPSPPRRAPSRACCRACCASAR